MSPFHFKLMNRGVKRSRDAPPPPPASSASKRRPVPYSDEWLRAAGSTHSVVYSSDDDDDDNNNNNIPGGDGGVFFQRGRAARRKQTAASRRKKADGDDRNDEDLFGSIYQRMRGWNIDNGENVPRPRAPLPVIVVPAPGSIETEEQKRYREERERRSRLPGVHRWDEDENQARGLAARQEAAHALNSRAAVPLHSAPSSSSLSSLLRGGSSVPTVGPPPAGAWAADFALVAKRYETIAAKEFEDSRISGKDEWANSDLKETPRSSGKDRYESIQNCLNNMGLTREAHQIQFHNSVLDACARHIYGIDYLACLEEIFARTGSEEIRQEILVQTPRRFGKTTMVAMIVAALAAFVPGIKIGIFSTAKRTSQKLMEEVKRFLFTIKGTQDRKWKENAEELWLTKDPIMHRTAGGAKMARRDPDQQTTSKIYCYAASERTTRGFTVDVTILEEAAHMSENIFNYVVVPALGTENMVLLAITTPKDPNNYFSRLTEMKREDGQLFFHVQQLGLACAACLARGAGTTCTHMQHLLPAWKGVTRQARVQAILGEHNKDVFAQEAQGMIVPEGHTVFEAQQVQRLRASKPFCFETNPQVIYTFIDPHGGGTQSSQAILSMVYAGGNKVVTFSFFLFLFCLFCLSVCIFYKRDSDTKTQTLQSSI